jgi:hypothetical protein
MRLSLRASYIYAWNGFRFLLDGQDLCLDVWPRSPVLRLPKRPLARSVQEVIKKPRRRPDFAPPRGNPVKPTAHEPTAQAEHTVSELRRVTIDQADHAYHTHDHATVEGTRFIA